MNENLTHLYKITNKINNKMYFGITTQYPPNRKNVNMIDSKTNEVVMTFNSKKEAGRWLHDNGHCSSNNPRSVMSTINRAIKLNTISYGYKWGETKESQSTIETTLKTEGSRVG